MKRKLLLSVFMLGICSSMFSSWPPASDYTIKEWQAGAGERAYGFGEIVYYQGGFYEVMNPDGVSSWGDAGYWNPENLSTTSDDGALCDCESDYQKVAEGMLWVEGMGTITEGVNYIWDGAVYKCIVSGESWGAGWDPTGWNSGSYEKICNIELAQVVVEDNILPDNYVGYWYDNELVWLPGWIAVNQETHLVYKCIVKTHANGGEYPGSTYGYWYVGDGAWNDPPVPICEEKDLLTTVEIPTWDDERSWPLGAIVELDGKYYTCLANTHKEGAEVPGAAGSDWGYWKDLELYGGAAGIKMIPTEQFTYSVQNGYLVVNSPAQVNIQLYNLAGQIIAKINGKSIELPGKGAYIAKINISGKIITVKILK